MIKKPIVAAIAYALCATVNQSAYAANDIEILSGSVQTNVTGTNYFLTTDDSAQLGIDKITSYWNDPASTSSITLYTTESGSNAQQGNITFSAALDFNTPGLGYSPSLYLNAHNDITLSSISDSDLLTADTLYMYLTPDTDAIGGGTVIANGVIEGDIIATINGDLVIGATGSYNLDNYLSADSIDNSAGGSFSFNSGALSLTNSDLTVGGGGLLGSNVVLDSSRRLSVGGTVNLDATGSMEINSGKHSFGAINNSAGNSIDFNSGTLSLANGSLTIGSDGALGSDLVLNNSRILNVVSGNITVDSGSTLSVNGAIGNFTSNNVYQEIGGALINNGATNLTAGALRTQGGIVNDGASASITLSGNSNSYDINYNNSAYLRTSTINNTNGANITLDGGILQATNIVNTNGASVTFNSGVLSLDTLTIGNDEALGNGFTLDENKFLIVSDTDSSGANGLLTIDSGANLTLDGGSLVVDNIDNAGTFTFNSGDIQVNGDGITVGVGGAFGNVLSLGNDSKLQFYNVSNNAGMFTVDAGASFSLDGGSLLLDYNTGLSVDGDFDFNSGYLDLGSNALTVGNSGLLGNAVTLGSNKTLAIDSTIVIESGASLAVNGGYLGVSDGISNTGSFSFNSGSLSLGGGLTVGNGGLLGNNVALSSNRFLSVSNGVTIEAGAKISLSSGTSSLSGGVTNNGTINVTGGDLYTFNEVVNNNRVNVSNGATLGRSYGGADTNYVQNAGRTTVNGTLSATSVVINAGRLDGAGVIDGDLTILGGTLGPGNSPGAMEITGDFVLTEAGTLHLEVGSDGLDPEGYLWDQLIVGGDYDLQGGLVKFSLLDGLDINNLESDFAIDDFFRTGTKDSDIGFDLLQLAMFGNLDLYAYDVSGDSWFSLALDETGGFMATASAPPVPVPAAVWLFGSGLLGLVGVARRKKA